MLKKLSVTNKTKKTFIERNASLHICDSNCLIECVFQEVVKLSLMGGLNVY